jgi:hypothetical protein
LEDAREAETERRVAGLVLLKVAGSVYLIGTQWLGPTSPFVSGGAALTVNVLSNRIAPLDASAHTIGAGLANGFSTTISATVLPDAVPWER